MARIAQKAVTADSVNFTFAEGTLIKCPVSDLPREMVDRLALHGIAQKVGDSYASAESITEAITNAKAVWTNLMAGIWATKAARGGKFVEALHRATGKAYDECLTTWQGMSDEDKKDLKAHPHIKKAIAEIEAENAQKAAEAAGDAGTDLNDLF